MVMPKTANMHANKQLVRIGPYTKVLPLVFVYLHCAHCISVDIHFNGVGKDAFCTTSPKQWFAEKSDYVKGLLENHSVTGTTRRETCGSICEALL